MEILLCIAVAIVGIGTICSIYNNEYKDWKQKREVNEWHKKKFGV